MFKIFCYNLKYIKLLKRLFLQCILHNFIDNRIGNNGIKELCNNFQYISNLSILSISGTDINEAALINIRNNISKLNDIKYLDISSI